MNPITAFQTSDGKIFVKMEEAKKHEVFLSKSNIIDDFLGSKENPYQGLAHMSIARSTIINWEHWKVTNEIASE